MVRDPPKRGLFFALLAGSGYGRRVTSSSFQLFVNRSGSDEGKAKVL